MDVNNEKKAINLLRELVYALDGTYWSSWQSAHKFSEQWDNAAHWLEEINEN